MAEYSPIPQTLRPPLYVQVYKTCTAYLWQLAMLLLINIIDKYSAIPHISSLAAIEISVEREGDRNEILHLAH